MNDFKKINLFEAFSGIGSQHQALKNIGYKVNIIGISDWYIDAIIAYGVNYLKIKSCKINRKKTIEFLKKYSLSRNSKTKLKSFSGISDENLSIIEQVIKKFGELDINKINGEKLINKNIDLFTYSFPCQDISQQGKRAGFSKGIKTRSGLLWEIERILKEIKKINKNKLPKILMMENVYAILNKEFKEDLDYWIKELGKLGYKSSKPFCLNASDLGEAQNRKRVFMISKLGKSVKDFKLKNKKEAGKLKNIIQKDLNHKEFETKKNIKIIRNFGKNNGIKKGFIEGYTTFNAECYVYHKNGQSPTITASGAQSRIKFFEGDKIFYLNSQEHLLLQGFDKKFYKKLKEFDFNENKIKFLAGNSINIKMLEEVFKFYL